MIIRVGVTLDSEVREMQPEAKIIEQPPEAEKGQEIDLPGASRRKDLTSELVTPRIASLSPGRGSNPEPCKC